MTSSNIKNYVDGMPLEDNLSAALIQVVEKGKLYLKGMLFAGRANDGEMKDGKWKPNESSYLKSRFDVSLENMDTDSEVIPISLSYDNITKLEEYDFVLDASTNVNFIVELNANSTSFVLHLSQKIYDFDPDNLTPIYKDTMSKSFAVTPLFVPSQRILKGELLNNYGNSQVLLTVNRIDNDIPPLTELIVNVQNMTTNICKQVILKGTDLTESKGSPEYITHVYNLKDKKKNKDERKIVETELRLPISVKEDLTQFPPVLEENNIYKFGVYAENTQGRSQLSKRVKVLTYLTPNEPEYKSITKLEDGSLVLKCKADTHSRVRLHLFNGVAPRNQAKYSFTVPYSVKEIQDNLRAADKTYKKIDRKVKKDPTNETLLNELDEAEEALEYAEQMLENINVDEDGISSITLTQSVLVSMYDEIFPTHILSTNAKIKELCNLIYGKPWFIALSSKFMYNNSDSAESEMSEKTVFLNNVSIDTITYTDVALNLGLTDYLLEWGAIASKSTFPIIDSIAKYKVSASLFLDNVLVKTFSQQTWDTHVNKTFNQTQTVESSLFDITQTELVKLSVKFEPEIDENGFDTYPKKNKVLYKNLLAAIDDAVSEGIITNDQLTITKFNERPQKPVFRGIRVSSNEIFLKLDQESKINTKDYQINLYKYNSVSKTYTPASYFDGSVNNVFPTIIQNFGDLGAVATYSLIIDGVNRSNVFAVKEEYAVGVISRSSNPNVGDSDIEYSERFSKQDFDLTEVIPTLYLNKRFLTATVDVTATVFLSKNTTKTKKVQSITLYSVDGDGNVIPDGGEGAVSIPVETNQSYFLAGKRYYKTKREISLDVKLEYRIVAQLVISDGLGDLSVPFAATYSAPAIFNTFADPEFLNVKFSKSDDSEEGVIDTIDFDVNLNGQSLSDLLPFQLDELGGSPVFVMILPTVDTLLGAVGKADLITGADLVPTSNTLIYHGSVTFSGEIVPDSYMLLLGLNSRQFIIARNGVYGTNYISG